MERQQQQRYEMFVRVREFGAKHQPQFPATSTAGKAFATVAEAAAAIERQRTQKEVNSQAGRKARAEARKDLWERLTDIARTAREVTRTELDSDARFQLPRRRSDAALLEVAHGFIGKGEAAAHAWVPLGLPETTIADLQRAVGRFQQAMAVRQEARRSSRQAQVNLRRAFAQGFAAVRQLDTIVANTLKHDEALLEAWYGDRRVAFRSKSTSKDAATSPAAPAAVTTTATTASPPAGEASAAAATTPVEGKSPARNTESAAEPELAGVAS